MNKNGSAIILVILLLIVGFIAGFVTGYGGGFGPSSPSTHQSIVNMISIHDTRWHVALSPKLVDSGDLVYGEYAIVSLQFTHGRTYKQSTWIWKRHGDTEFCMTIWGPGDDGETYSVELSRLLFNPCDVKLNGELLFKVPQNTDRIEHGNYVESTKPGYFIFDVHLRISP